jgi:glycerol-3-phosphate dehydrogenase
MWTQGWREEIFGRLDRQWDVIIVGGGITGAGILLEATRAGLSALLIEARDFASGTSSRSTKLVHGGLRYLRQAQFRVTRESVLERERLLREAGGLVTPLGFYLTSFTDDQMPGWMFGAGLAIYDLIARKWQHEKFKAQELIESVPSLTGAAVKGGYHYYDAQTDDARLTVRVLREAVQRGGTALSYARATAMLRDARGRVRGLVVRDEAGSGREVEVQARAVINATGAWADDLRKQIGAERKLRAIRGSHLIFPASRIPLPAAVSLLHPRDGRAVFAIPWEGITLVGTTDVDHKDDLEREPTTSADEAEYILESVRRAFPSLELQLSDVRASFSGVRSVVDTGVANPAKESREHAVWKENGLLTVTGGKLTTFRLMALAALRALGDAIPGIQIPKREEILELPPDAVTEAEIDIGTKARLLGRYGKDASAVLTAGRDAVEPIGDALAIWGELRWAARAEGVVHLDDLLLRRVRIGLLLPEGGLPLMERIGQVVRPELGWDDARWASEVARYRETWTRCYGTTFVA